MSTPLATVSGIASTNGGMMHWFARNTVVSVITTKSVQVTPNPGNREPIFVEPEPGSFRNAVGLRNPGLEATKAELEKLMQVRKVEPWPAGVLLNVSLAGGSPEEFATLARELRHLADILELNLSCPHARGNYGSAIGSDPELVREYTAAVTAVANGTPVYVKLTPNVADIVPIARAAMAGGATGIVAINTMDPAPYIEEHSGASVLNNPPEGRGGKSGRWVRHRAIECVAAIRGALGPEVPIIGMGGVESRDDVTALTEAGASVVGVGSVLARLHQRDWPQFLAMLAGEEGESSGQGVEHNLFFTAASAKMEMKPAVVTHREEISPELFEIDVALEHPFTYRSGQTCFLWIPGVGEKPFSPAGAEPLRFLVARRGPFTRALGELNPGDTLYMRGPYGTPLELPPLRQTADPTVADSPASAMASDIAPAKAPATPPAVLILAGGSGMALVPSLVREWSVSGGGITAGIGLRAPLTPPPLARDTFLQAHSSLHYVADDGIPGRVLELIDNTEADHIILVGPEPFMAAGVQRARRAGYDDTQIILSLEQPMLCGVGICGACHNNGSLTCHHGTLVTANQWSEGHNYVD